MAAINKTQLSFLLIILGSLLNLNSSLEIKRDDNLTSSSDGDRCCKCPKYKNPGCDDPCVLDPPEVYIDPSEGIPNDDASLTILVDLQWPLRDYPWYIQVFTEFLLPKNTLEKFPGGVRIKERPRTTTEAPVITANPLVGAVNTKAITEEDIKEVAAFAKETGLESVVKLLDQDDEVKKLEAIALKEGQKLLDSKKEIEAQMQAGNVVLSTDDPAHVHQQSFRRRDTVSSNLSTGGMIFVGATQSFKKSIERTIPVNPFSVSAFVLFGPIDLCFETFKHLARPVLEDCSPDSPYRSLDGTCNNVANDLWGAAFTPYRRDLHPYYDDGVWKFRKSVIDGQDLPSPREIIININTARSGESQSFNTLHMTYGQFIDHDLVSTPLAKGSYGDGTLKCCPIPSRHPECAAFEIPPNDEFYGCYSQTCMEFVRSAPITPFCRLSPAQQINQHTAYLDGSVIYGVKSSETDELRSFSCGLLKGQAAEDGHMLLPKEMNPDDGCNTPEMMNEGKYCFKAGDGRVNEQVLLTFFQTLFAREHNRIAKSLCKCHTSWDDEKIFQETRRIIGALLQQVTYNEFLPTIIGPTLMMSSKLYPLKGEQQTDDYDSFVDATVANNFAAAAYRFGHSLITDNLVYVTRHGKTSPKQLSTLFFNPFELYRRDGVCDVARGGMNHPQDKMDPLFSLEVAGKLFRGHFDVGLDLPALNIQRGRDHGLPPYVKWREFCGHKDKVKTFEDLRNEMSPDRIQALVNAYAHVDDIDLFAGGISEDPIPGSLLGHTFTCLIHNQFFRMKYGDRYWFEYKNGPGAFKPDQIEQLHEATLARIMCNNLPELEYIQRWPLRNPGPDNPKVCCKSIRHYKLNPWVPDCPLDDYEDYEHDEGFDYESDKKDAQND